MINLFNILNERPLFFPSAPTGGEEKEKGKSLEQFEWFMSDGTGMKNQFLQTGVNGDEKRPNQQLSVPWFRDFYKR